MNYFLAPRGSGESYQNFLSTIKRGVSYEDIRPHLSEEGKSILENQERICAWGNKEGTRVHWEKIKAGDTVLFTADKKVFLSAEVYFKERSSDLALAMWPPDKDGTVWEYTFFLRNLRYLSIPMPIFNMAAGYNETYIVQGFVIMKEDKVAKMSNGHGSVEAFVEKFLTEDSPEAPAANEVLKINLPADVMPLFLMNPHISPKPAKSGKKKALSRPIKINHIHRNIQNAVTGSTGEEIVLKYEREALKSLGRVDLSEKVTRVSLEDDSLGYDILSYDQAGTPKYIEVKSTVSRKDSPRFYMSSKEMAIARELDNYRLYYVVGVNSRIPIISNLTRQLLDGSLDIIPDSYLVEGVSSGGGAGLA
jgi:hypothetical protein